MKTKMITSASTLSAMLITVVFLFIASCQKEVTNPSASGETNVGMAKRGTHTRNYSSDVAQEWMKMQMQIMKTTAGISNLAFVRPFAYSGIAMYESVLPGMPSYQTLVGQLTDLPAMPAVTNNLTYNWGSSANASMAKFLKLIYPTMSSTNVDAVNALESTFNTEFSANSDVETISRSVAFGREVAQTVYDWSLTDGNANLNNSYTPLLGPGLWVPIPSTQVPLGPYWRYLRVMVAGSGNNAQPPAPPTYSETVGSDFYNMVKQVYDVSQPALTQAQNDQAMFWRDIPGLSAGGHYLSIIQQVLEQENSNLEIAAAAYALTCITVYDASISTWETKYTYNLVRPITYIRNVLGHTTWSPLLGTPGHPEYSSAHASLSSSVAAALTNVFGDNYSFTDHSYDYLGFPARSFNSFTAFGEDAGNSRLYAGIHYQLSIDRGFLQGRTVAHNILNTLILKKP